MKLHVMSDLHLDHHRNPFRPTCEDEAGTTLILAGDVIGLTPQNFKAALAFFIDVVNRYKHVIYVTGNHEYYGTGWEGAHHKRTDLEMEVYAATHKDVLIAEDFATFDLDGQRFLCGTGWIPEPARGTPNISDASCIKRYKPEVFNRHKTFCKWLNTMLLPTDVVVSHHLPSNRSIAAQYYGDIYNAWFVAPKLERDIVARKPKLWIHGHTHTSFDYYIGPTRVLCNPRGYPNEFAMSGQGPTFHPKLVIDV